MKALALWAEDRDEFDGAVDGTEPVRRQRRELDRLPGFDRQVVVAEQQPERTVEDVQPVVPLMDR